MNLSLTLCLVVRLLNGSTVTFTREDQLWRSRLLPPSPPDSKTMPDPRSKLPTARTLF